MVPLLTTRPFVDLWAERVIDLLEEQRPERFGPLDGQPGLVELLGQPPQPRRSGHRSDAIGVPASGRTALSARAETRGWCEGSSVARVDRLGRSRRGRVARRRMHRDDDASQSAATSRPRASTTSSAPPDPIVCNGTDEFNQDDDGAVQALLQPSQLAAVTGPRAEMPPCPWALSADELLAVPECRAAAASADAPANDEARNGNARVAYTSAHGVQVDDRIEIYTSRQNVDAIRAILVSRSLPRVLRTSAAAARGRRPRQHGGRRSVENFDLQADPPRSASASPPPRTMPPIRGSCTERTSASPTTSEGSSEPIAMRVITFGTGGLMSTLTLIGATPADVDAVDVSHVLRGAASSFTAMFEPS